VSADPGAGAGPDARTLERGNLILIGMRGSGKSTVGRLLAERMGWPFVDTDELVERQVGGSVRDIFERAGETAFRAHETAALRAVLARRGQVVSAGGGAVLAEVNRELLRSAGFCVWLRCAPAELVDRLSRPDRGWDGATAPRPRLTSLPPDEEVRQLLLAREPLYEALADGVVDTTHLTPATVVERVLALPGGLAGRTMPDDDR
jgi:shikimate kinase